MTILTSIYDFFNTYFILPIKQGTGYNTFNTIGLAALFLILVDATEKSIRKLKIPMNTFLKSFIPYILLGGVIRALRDISIYQGDVFVTPAIYLLMLGLTFFDAYFQIPVGWILLAINLSAITFQNTANLLILLFAITTTGLSLTILKSLKIKVNYLIIVAFFAHMLDAASTFIAFDIFGCLEQHVVANTFINLTNTAAVMFPLKMLALLVIVHFFEDIKNSEYKAFLYWMVIALGLGPGIRNTLLVTITSCSPFKVL